MKKLKNYNCSVKHVSKMDIKLAGCEIIKQCEKIIKNITEILL